MSRYIPIGAVHFGGKEASVPRLGRGELAAGLFTLGFVSAATDRLAISVTARGWFEAFINTFDISAIVWGSALVAVGLAGAGTREPLRRADIMVAAIGVVLLVAPVSLVNWVGLTAIAVYFAACSPPRSPVQRGALVWIVICFSMFWSPRIFAIFSDYVLSADAELVSWITGTQRVGNTVEMRDGKGFLWIAPGCSSMANVSLALLCWSTFAQLSNRAATLGDIAWCGLICLCVVAINVTRIGLIGLYPEWYHALHGPGGTLVFGYVTLFVVAGMCILWKKRELFYLR